MIQTTQARRDLEWQHVFQWRSARLRIRRQSGRAGLAEVFVAETGTGYVEFVDGLDPPKSRTEKWIVNVSTQSGCPVGCPYCDAGTQFAGNLSADEILAQVAWILDRHGRETASRCRKLKVHFSRMGEPALNPSVLEALRCLRELAPWPDVWACIATTAPRTASAFFRELSHLKDRFFPGRFQLQFSLNSTDPEERARLVPIPHWTFEEIASYGERFWRPGDRKVVLNFALARHVSFEPEVLLAHFEPRVFAVKLTPVNPTARGSANGFTTVLRTKEGEGLLSHAVRRLASAGFDVILSVGDPGEDEVGSNCGQAVLAAGLWPLPGQPYP